MNNNLINSVILAVGIATGGFLIGRGFIASKYFDQYVTVKGLAEREVRADMAIWPISYTVASNDLKDLEKKLKNQAKIISDFLIEKGVADTEINIGAPSITDFRASYYGGNNYNPFRYMGKGKITVTTQKVSEINKAVENLTDLLGQGIVIEQDEYRNRVNYEFTQLNNIKPEMIREATLNAREAAQKFADDSGAGLGKIRKATQGYFSITDRDINSPHIKKIRVVTTVEYFLD